MQGQCPSAISGLPSAPGARGTSGSKEVPVGSGGEGWGTEQLGNGSAGLRAQPPTRLPSPLLDLASCCLKTPGSFLTRPCAHGQHSLAASAQSRGRGRVRVHRGNHRRACGRRPLCTGQAAQTGAQGRQWCLPPWALRALLPTAPAEPRAWAPPSHELARCSANKSLLLEKTTNPGLSCFQQKKMGMKLH